MISLGRIISQLIQIIFSHLGSLISRYKFWFLCGPLIISCLSTVGILRFVEENRIWFLYSPSDAPSHYEHAVANEFFDDRGGKFFLEVPVTSIDGGNLLRQGYLEAVEDLSYFLQYNLTVFCDLKQSRLCSFNDVCSGNCNDNQVIPIFRLIHRNDSQRLHPNFRLTYPTMRIYNDEYYVGEHFSGISINRSTNRISEIKLIVLYFRTDRQDSHTNDVLNRWESKLLSFIRDFHHPLINISCSSDGIFSHEVRRNGISCIPYFALSVFLVFCFIFFTNNSLANDVSQMQNGLFISFIGTLGPLIAIYTTFNLMFILGIKFNSITLVVPFLIMGVGCDDVFIIVHAWRKTNRSDTLEVRLAKTMEEAGPSITVTSLTNALSFGIGIFTKTPAIRIFCAYATVGVIIDFLYQITFFASSIAYEGCRTGKVFDNPLNSIQSSSMSKVTEKNVPDPLLKAHNRIVVNYCHILKSFICQMVVLTILVVYWIISIYGCLTMKIKMDSTNLLLRDSPMNNIAWLYENYLWKEGTLFYVFINKPPNLLLESGRNDVLNAVSHFENLNYSMGKNSTSFWLRSFLSQVSYYRNDPSFVFYNILELWLKDEGKRWNETIRYQCSNTSITNIKSFIFATALAMGNHSSWLLRAELQQTWRSLANDYHLFNLTVYQPYSFYIDQLNSIQSTTFNTILVAMISMCTICFLTIPSISSILFSTLAMVSINIGVFGGLSLWNVYMDPLTMCTTLTSIGFSVDFTVHICYHYYRYASEESSEKRLINALSCIGWPMIQAGLSTILCISPLLLVNSYMIYVFLKTIFLVIVLGLIHGILFLPCILLTVDILMARLMSNKRQSNIQSDRKLIAVQIKFSKNKFERMISAPPCFAEKFSRKIKRKPSMNNFQCTTRERLRFSKSF